MNQRIEPRMLSEIYRVTDASCVDFEELYRLYTSNRGYFTFFSLEDSRANLSRDMTMLPDGCLPPQKHFVVYTDEHERMTALLDLIEGYPDEASCYIGLFMVEASCAGRGIGTAIIGELCGVLRRLGFQRLRLAYGKHYRNAARFWTKNGFVPIKEAVLDAYGELIVAERRLCADQAAEACC